MKIEFLENAQTELDQAFEWSETQQKNSAMQFLNGFAAAIKRIISYPESYILLEKSVRRCWVKRFPYGILYGIDVGKIIIIAVAHLHRKPDYWLERT